LLATRAKRLKTFTTVWFFFRNKRMDHGLTGGDEFGGEVDNSTIHPWRGKMKIISIRWASREAELLASKAVTTRIPFVA
jgi:hypothetical protein